MKKKSKLEDKVLIPVISSRVTRKLESGKENIERRANIITLGSVLSQPTRISLPSDQIIFLH